MDSAYHSTSWKKKKNNQSIVFGKKKIDEIWKVELVFTVNLAMTFNFHLIFMVNEGSQ